MQGQALAAQAGDALARVNTHAHRSGCVLAVAACCMPGCGPAVACGMRLRMGTGCLPGY